MRFMCNADLRRVLSPAILFLSLGAAVGLGDSIEDQVARHLPRDATLMRVSCPRPGDAFATAAAAVAVQTGRPGDPGLAFVYKRGEGLALRVVRFNTVGVEEVDAPLPGSFVSPLPAFPSGILLRDLGRLGSPQVLVVTSDGASVGLFLSVFSLGETGLASAIPGGVIGGHGFDLDCESGRACRIASFGKWTDQETSWVQVYEWRGSALAETGKDAGAYFSERLTRLGKSAATAEAMPVPLRTQLTSQAVQLYLDRHEPGQAVRLCEVVLSLLDDPARSAVRASLTAPASPAAMFQSDLREGKAVLHELLGKGYEALDRNEEAQVQYELAQALRAGGTAR